MAWYATLSSDEAAQISRLGALAAARAAEAVTAWNRAAAYAADAADAVAAVDFTKCCRCAVEARAAEKDGARAAARAKTYPIMRVRGGVLDSSDRCRGDAFPFGGARAAVGLPSVAPQRLIRNDCSSRDTRSRGCTANLRHKIAKGAVAQDSELIRSCTLSH